MAGLILPQQEPDAAPPLDDPVQFIEHLADGARALPPDDLQDLQLSGCGML